MDTTAPQPEKSSNTSTTFVINWKKIGLAAAAIASVFAAGAAVSGGWSSVKAQGAVDYANRQEVANIKDTLQAHKDVDTQAGKRIDVLQSDVDSLKLWRASTDAKLDALLESAKWQRDHWYDNPRNK